MRIGCDLYGLMDWMNGQMDELIDQWVNKWVDGWNNDHRYTEWMDIYILLVVVVFLPFPQGKGEDENVIDHHHHDDSLK